MPDDRDFRNKGGRKPSLVAGVPIVGVPVAKPGSVPREEEWAVPTGVETEVPPVPARTNESGPYDMDMFKRIEERSTNAHRAARASFRLLSDHTEKDELQQKRTNDTLLVHSTQLDTLVRVIAPRSGATSAEIRARIEGKKWEYRKQLIVTVGGIVLALIGVIAAYLKLR